MYRSTAFLLFCLCLAPAVNAQISLDSARTLPKNTRVTVTGFVTVANEFGGPLYFQDATAGLAVYKTDLHAAAQIGDSIVVTGPLGEFGATNGQPGTGLLEVTGTGITYEVFNNVNRPQTPRVVTLADLGEALEGQLLRVQNVTIDHEGAFSQNTSYPITDASGAATLYIDNDTDLVGASAPGGAIDLVGVLGQYRGTYQLLPRSTADLGVEPYVIPGEEVSRDATLEVGTWNIRWFGSPNERPDDDALQLQNAARVLREMQLDVVGLQEISNPTLFRQLVDSLDGYRGILAPISQTQKTAILYRTATIDSVSAGFYFTSGDWASGRYPYAFTFDATIGEKTRRFTLLNLHAKATLSATRLQDYSRRQADAAQLKAQLDARNPDDNLIVVGDFNDDVDRSVVNDQPSPYASFVADSAHYRFLTASLSERGFQSISGGQMFDHILVSDEVLRPYFEGTERVENPLYIGSYLSTTSDHYPVWVRFDFDTNTRATASEAPSAQALGTPYPSPTRGQTRIPFHLDASGPAEIAVFDLLGRRVATVQNAALPAGGHVADYDASALAPGLYLVRLTTANATASTVLVRM